MDPLEKIPIDYHNDNGISLLFHEIALQRI